jgi:hypothetical protein
MNEQTLPDEIMEPRLWKKNGWTAKVIKNEDDDGWAVAMYQDGRPDPALVGPWTMGRDKKNPKPLDNGAFNTLVKTARDVLQRAANAEHARLHKVLTYTNNDGIRVRANLDLVADEDDPHAILTCTNDQTGEELLKQRVAANFKMTAEKVQAILPR